MRAAFDYEKSRGASALWIDLREYGSEDRFVRDVFEVGLPALIEKDSSNAWVFLDSLDEALVRIDTLAALFIGGISKFPLTKLHLRVACRTAIWPPSLSDGLVSVWG